MKIYYSIDLPDLINVQYKLNDETVYDAFKSLTFFKSDMKNDFPEATLIEITEDNYEELRDLGEVC